jgi:hypothetical protein
MPASESRPGRNPRAAVKTAGVYGDLTGQQLGRRKRWPAWMGSDRQWCDGLGVEAIVEGVMVPRSKGIEEPWETVRRQRCIAGSAVLRRVSGTERQ